MSKVCFNKKKQPVLLDSVELAHFGNLEKVVTISESNFGYKLQPWGRLAPTDCVAIHLVDKESDATIDKSMCKRWAIQDKIE